MLSHLNARLIQSTKMKHFGALCIFLALVHFSTQISKYENCPEHIVKRNNPGCECCKVTCVSEGEEMRMLGCPVSLCRPGTQIGYHNNDNTKEYPDCCGYPICDTY